jgi:hypothetical protein
LSFFKLWIIGTIGGGSSVAGSNHNDTQSSFYDSDDISSMNDDKEEEEQIYFNSVRHNKLSSSPSSNSKSSLSKYISLRCKIDSPTKLTSSIRTPTIFASVHVEDFSFCPLILRITCGMNYIIILYLIFLT